ncbi:MAG: TRAP transporter small permease [Pseudomonadota bacterium]
MYGMIDRLARAFALLGGAVLSALVLLTCLSIAGRLINTVLHGGFAQTAMPGLADALLAAGVGPINGDFELVEAGMAFAIFAFLPLCQLKGAHASVDVFANRFRPLAHRVLSMIIDLTFAAILILIAWQLFLGLLSKMNSGQTTFLLEFPLWWAYAFSLSGALVAACVAAFVAAIRVVELMRDVDILPVASEAEH